jgi:micrococcal nuclease
MKNDLFLALFLIFIISCTGQTELLENTTAVVVEVIDGDTIRLDNGEVVRLLGIDTPERGEEGYYAAAERLRELVEDKEVVLIRGNSSNRDRYGRLLRYVFVNNLNESINELMLKEGYAVVYGKT